MRYTRQTLPVIMLFCLAGCASRGDVDSIQRDMDEMKARLVKMERDVGEVKNVAREELEKSLKGFQQDIDAMRKGAADIQANLDSARVDMQVLSGKVDDVALQARKPADDVALLKEDTNRRLAAFEERLLKLEKGMEELPKKLAEVRSKEAEKNPESLYQQGLESFRGGDPQKGRDHFTRFLELYPNHELAANARYWLGETYYSEKKYEQAILEFQEVIRKFPGKEKVPAAMLKQAMAFKELGDLKSARYVLKKLLEDFPTTEEAKPAKERLKEWK